MLCNHPNIQEKVAQEVNKATKGKTAALTEESLNKVLFLCATGTIIHLFVNLRRILDFQTDISHKYKTFRMLAPSCNYIFTVDPINIEYILKTNFPNYGKGKTHYELTKDILGDGIFAVNGEQWRHQRKIASYEFSTKVLRDSSGDIFKSNARKLALRLLKAASTNQIFDIQNLFKKSTMDTISKVALGVDLDTLSGTNDEGRFFTQAFDDANRQFFVRYFDILWKIKKFLNVGSEARMRKNVELIDGFVYKLIHMKIEEKCKEKDDLVDKKVDILSRFLIEREKDPDNISYKYLRDIILSFMIAGRDATAATLSWFFFMLCKHPNIQEKVAQEVKEATNTKEKPHIEEFAATLTEEALNNMQYLQATLTETLRLYPAVPVDVKCCFSDDKLPDGFNVNKGDMVHYQPFAMGRMKFLWGEDAEIFRPERWLDENGCFQPENPFKFPVFQAGPRICLGKDFAYRQMKIFAATLVRFLKFKLWDEEKAVEYETSATLSIAGGLHLCAMER